MGRFAFLTKHLKRGTDAQKRREIVKLRHHVRHWYTGGCLALALVVVLGTAGYQQLTGSTSSDLPATVGAADHSRSRILSTSNSTNSTDSGLPICNPGNYPKELFTMQQKKQGAIALYIVGVIYTFVGLAIICDEFFVPALERIVEVLDISDDVAGATFMAAGGSAPELFTSFMGVFASGSDVGFGTIVGSAVFNVLFVIGMCAIFSRELLELTWWPLFRDCSYYVISLTVLSVFFGMDYGSGKNKIEWWEALILFGMYIGYVTVMKFNQKLYRTISGCTKKKKKKANSTAVVPKGDGGGMKRRPSTFIRHTVSLDTQQELIEEAGMTSAFLRPCKFRAGVLSLMLDRGDKSIINRTRTFVVADLVGDFEQTFVQIDTNGDGMIDRKELKELLRELTGQEPSKDDVDLAMKDMKPDENGEVSKEAFRLWYMESEARVMKQAHDAFDDIDNNGDGRIDYDELRQVLQQLSDIKNGPAGTKQDTVAEQVNKVMHDFGHQEQVGESGASTFCITFDEFMAWYKNSMLFAHHMKQQEADVKRSSSLQPGGGDDDDGEGEPISLAWPDTCKARILYLVTLPIIGLLFITTPDVRNPKFRNWFPLTFLMSIMWIAVYSYLMVWWATVIGIVANIPDTVMGLTFLAAGTSIPDLLTSVIVARQGLGDMAVSSSVGSNIFDILVGLPIPWLTYSALNGGKPSVVYSNSLFLSVLILIGMLAAVVIVIASCGWKMSKALGGIMFALYAVFVVQDLVRADWSIKCQVE